MENTTELMEPVPAMDTTMEIGASTKMNALRIAIVRMEEGKQKTHVDNGFI